MIKLFKVAVGVLACMAGGWAAAEDYPSRPIRIVVTFPPGQGADVVARRMGPKMSASLGQPIVIDNRPGAGGTVGSDYVAKARPDGYTLVLGTTATHAANQFLYSKIPYDAAADFTPIVPMVAYGVLVAVPAASPFKTLPELIAQAKAKPNGLEAGITSTTARIVYELLKSKAGVDIVQVPYTGTPGAVTDALAGRLAMIIDTSSALLGQMKAGTLRPLAVAAEKRVDSNPDVPTFKEYGLDVVVAPMNGLFGPKGTPPEVVKAINAAVNKAFADKELVASFVREGAQPVGGTPEDLARAMRDERLKWEPIVKATGMKVE